VAGIVRTTISVDTPADVALRGDEGATAGSAVRHNGATTGMERT